MATFEYRTELARPRAEVFDWFTKPGALLRLNPPFGGSVRQEPTDGLNPGSTAKLGIGAPGALGLFGTAVAAFGLPVKPEVGWVAEHTELEPGVRFVDEMQRGPFRKWRHEHRFDDDGDGTVMTDVVEFELPRAVATRWSEGQIHKELGRVFAYRERQVSGDLEFQSRMQHAPLKVAITGGNGLIGSQVRALLGGGGHDVVRLVRGKGSGSDISWDPKAGTVDMDKLAECDVVVHLGGHPIGGRFTAATKQKIMSSRTSGTSTLARALAALASDGRQRTFVVASATGFYGAQPHAAERAAGRSIEPLDEDAPAGYDFLASVCVAWEEACRPAWEAGVRVANIRTGLVLSPASGYMSRFLPLYLAGVGGPMGRDEWQSWIGIDDVAGVYVQAIVSNDVEGPVNAVAPNPVTAREFAKTLGRVLRRPSVLPVPKVGPWLLLGSQGVKEMAEADQRVAPKVLERVGFPFRHRHLEDQLRHVLGR